MSGSETIASRNPGSEKNNYGEYCSIEETIKALALDQEFSEIVFYLIENDLPSPSGTYQKFQDRSRYKNNSLFSQRLMNEAADYTTNKPRPLML